MDVSCSIGDDDDGGGGVESTDARRRRSYVGLLLVLTRSRLELLASFTFLLEYSTVVAMNICLFIYLRLRLNYVYFVRRNYQCQFSLCINWRVAM